MRLMTLPGFRKALAALPLLMGATACNLQFSTGIEAKDTWNRTYKVNPGVTVELREPNGRIRVEAGSGSEVEVAATRVVKGPSEQTAKAALADFTIRDTATADRVEIDSTAAASGGLLSRITRRVDYDVKMPRTGELTIRTTNGEIIVRSVAGFVKIETVNGDIEATGIERGADVNAVNGRVQLELSAVGEGGVRCKTTNGQIIVTVPDGAKANIEARVVNGIVHTENLPIQSTESSRRRLDAAIGGGGPQIRLDTTNGEIRIVGRQTRRP